MSDSLNVLLGVTGGIAAVKAPALVRRLQERGHRVRCALTRSAPSFVAPLALEVLTGAPVYGEDYLEPNGSGEELHVTAGQWADVLVIAPATANTIARLALGLADDFLTTTALMHDGPIVVAPAMHSTMWSQPTVAEHVARLAARGAVFVGPEDGPLASGESGIGRMSEVEEIARQVELAAAGVARRTDRWRGRTILVSAGPTEEPIDDVRFLSNRSSGRMGFAIATEAVRRGADVHLVAGPVSLGTPPGVARIDVRTAAEMYDAVRGAAGAAEVVVMCAAVADFRPTRRVEGKLKKSRGLDAIELEPTADILAALRDVSPHALLVGFAAESADLEAEARRKLESKRLDLIVANDISRPDIGFQSGDNEVTLFARDGDPVRVSRRSKPEVARAILDRIEQLRGTRGPQAVASGR